MQPIELTLKVALDADGQLNEPILLRVHPNNCCEDLIPYENVVRLKYVTRCCVESISIRLECINTLIWYYSDFMVINELPQIDNVMPTEAININLSQVIDFKTTVDG